MMVLAAPLARQLMSRFLPANVSARRSIASAFLATLRTVRETGGAAREDFLAGCILHLLDR
jgi:hypothetical protein